MLGAEEKESQEQHQLSLPEKQQDVDVVNQSSTSHTPRLSSPQTAYSVSTRLKHWFPLVKSRSSQGTPNNTTSIPTPTIITTSPPSVPVSLHRSASFDVENSLRLSTSSADNSAIAGSSSAESSARTSTSNKIPPNVLSPPHTHLHVISSSAVAAAIGNNRIHFEDTISLNSADERSSTSLPALIRNSPPLIRTPAATPDIPMPSTTNITTSNTPTPSIASTTKEKLLLKLIPSHFLRRAQRRHHRKNNSVTSIPGTPIPPSPIIRSAPSSPKLSPVQSAGFHSSRSSNDGRPSKNLLPVPLLALKSSESLPATRTVTPLLSTSPVARRGRSSTVSSVSSDAPPRTSRSRTRRPSMIFSNLKGKESGRGTPVEKLSLEMEEEGEYVLPPIDTNSGEEYFRKLQLHQDGISIRCVRKLVESSDPIHVAALGTYLDTIPFSGFPLDMAMRHLLIHIPLPKEQGAIYRLLELFARRYHACNPSLWDSLDQILVVCYSILMLNTDAWNSANKVKMTREQYIRNTSGQEVCEDILSCWYDNITLTPFLDSSHPTLSKLRAQRPSLAERLSRPAIDMYTALLESRLDDFKIVYSTKGKDFTPALENQLHYTGTIVNIPVWEIHETVEGSPRVTLLNRSRTKSEGFPLTRASVLNPLHGESSRLVKVGIFPRRERTTRFGRVSGWQWIDSGIFLLDTKIIFVRKGDLTAPLKSLMTAEKEVDFEGGESLIPPLNNEVILNLAGSVAFYDTGTSGPTDWPMRIVNPYGESTIICFHEEDKLNDWVAAFNYLATLDSARVPQEDPVAINMLRRRAGTMAPPAGRPVPLRSVSSTLELRGRSKSEQPLPPLQDKISAYTAFLKELEAKSELQRITVDSLLRQARGLLIQTPFQDRTRFQVLVALEKVTKRLKSSRIDMERGLCYADVLRQTVELMAERKIRIVPEEKEYLLPMLGFVRNGEHAKSPSTSTLFSALNQLDDIDVPVRTIESPTMESKLKIDKEVSGEKQVERTIVQDVEHVSTSSLPILEKSDSEPVIEQTSSGKLSPLAENISATPKGSQGDLKLRVAEIGRIIKEGGF